MLDQSPTTGPLVAYRRHIASGKLRNDQAQQCGVEQLQLLANRLSDWDHSRSMRLLDQWLGRKKTVPRGLYLFGGVGRGKTMLMDLFYEHVDFAEKKRLHYHPFMRKVHGLIKLMRERSSKDPITLVADEIMQDMKLLCLDELHVNDITDAMILGRLFTALFERGLVLVTTSNSAPSQLYKDGLNRQLFLPFVELVEQKMEVLELDAMLDYRRDNFHNTPHYFTPTGDEARQQLDEIWTRFAGGAAPHDGGLDVGGGRRLVIPCMGGGMARFSFDDLCGKPLGASDYLTLCEHFHTFFVDDIPQLLPERANEARRFITLIDTFYDQKRSLIVSCDVEPDQIYLHGPGAKEFARTASRLSKMRQSSWPE